MRIRPKCVVIFLLFLPTLEAYGASVKGVQTGITTSSGNGTVTVGITAVDTAKSFLLFQSRHNFNRPPGSMIRGRIASPTSLEFTRDTNESSTMTIRWYVVEYASGVIVQRGSVTQSATIIDVAITPVTALNQAFVTCSKAPYDTDTSWGSDDPVLAELTSTSNVQFRVDNDNSDHTIWWQVIEFTDAADINVQKGSITTMTGATVSVTANLTPAVDVNSTFVLVGFLTPDTGSDVGARMLRAELTDATTVTIDRSIAGNDDITEIFWQAVELKDGSVVQRGSENFPSGVAQRTVNISTVDTARAVAFASVQPAGGQNMGRSSYSGDDVIGVGSVTMDLTSTTVIMDRDNTAAPADIGWFVVEWGGRPRLLRWAEIEP